MIPNYVDLIYFYCWHPESTESGCGTTRQ